MGRSQFVHPVALAAIALAAVLLSGLLAGCGEPERLLTPVNADVIDRLIAKLQGELGVTSVMVTHDVRGAFAVADRVALLKEGRIRAMGPPKELIASDDEAVREFIERDFDSVQLKELER